MYFLGFHNIISCQVLPKNSIKIIWHSFPKRVYVFWVSAVHLSCCTVVAVVLTSFEEVGVAVAPRERRVNIRRNSGPDR